MQTSDLAWLSFTSGSGFLGAIKLVTSGEVTGVKLAEEDWADRGCSSPVADESILGTPASLGKMAFTSEMGDEVGARRVGSEGRGIFANGLKNSCLQARPPHQGTNWMMQTIVLSF